MYYDAVVRHYSLLAQTYADFYLKDYPAWHHIAKRRLNEVLKMLPDISGKKILDVGCGPGYFANELAGLNAEVIGIDGAPDMIEASSRIINSQKVKIRLTDIHKLELDENQFDIIICLNTFRHLRNPYKALSEMYRVLKKEGLLILEIHNKLSPGGPLLNLLKILFRNRKGYLQKLNLNVGPIDKYYSLSEIKSLLSKAGFECKEYSYFLFTSPQMEGRVILSFFKRAEKALELTPLRALGGLILLKCVKK